MKKELLKINPPKEYKDGLFVVEDGADNIPEFIDYIKAGYSVEEAHKMEILVRIEMMKHDLRGNAASSEEYEEAENYIKELILQYNQK